MENPLPRLTDNALCILRHRYLAKDATGAIVETPSEMFRRVASAVAGAERSYDGGRQARTMEEEFYRLMAEGVFMPNSPTLMNAGRAPGMLSACFVLPIEDSIDGIFESVKHAAIIQKAGGGTGFVFDHLRPTGDYIASSGRVTSGPIAFWRVFSQATSAIQQGAFRRGANMGMMSVTHPDVLKFITAKQRPGQFENFNVSVKVGDEFMADLASRPENPHVVVNPRTKKRYVIAPDVDPARYSLGDLVDADAAKGPCMTVADVWEMIVSCAHATGEPGLCFIDRLNADNPTPQLGPIEATNPCGEQPLLNYEACNLGSINVARFVGGGDLDESSFGRAVELGVRFLDDVIDVNNYLIEPVKKICAGNRKIGLGVMGFADALMELEIPYDSDEALDFGRKVARVLTERAFAASEELAEHRGCFPNHPGSLWDTRHRRPMRNAAVTAVAPTGTISIVAGCSGGIEPLFALAFWRNVLGPRRMIEVSDIFERAMKRRGLWSEDLIERLASGKSLSQCPGIPPDIRRVFATAQEIPPASHVRMQAAFQKYIDGAISKTVNLPAGATVRDVDRVYRQAHRSGCKGITVYRDGCRPSQPMGFESVPLCPNCRCQLDERAACSRCPRCGFTICV